MLSDELKIEFFLKKEDVVIDNLDALANSWQEYFYSFNELGDDQLTEHLQKNPEYIEGAICVWYYGLEIVSFKEWDLIDQLLFYFVQSFHEILIRERKNVSFFFPDQPLEVTMTLEGDSIVIGIGDSSTSRITITSLIKIFIPESKLFFRRLSSCLLTDKYDDVLSLIDDISE